MHKKLKCQPFNTMLLIRFKKYSNTLGAVLKCAKSNYFKSTYCSMEVTLKRNWQLIEEFLNKNDSHVRLTKITLHRTLILNQMVSLTLLVVILHTPKALNTLYHFPICCAVNIPFISNF